MSTLIDAPSDDEAQDRRSPTRIIRQYELVDTVRSYQETANEDLLNRAYVYTVVKHGSQKRASGDPYYGHPVAVAGLLAELHLDESVIVAALLHDTVEDTDATIQEIAENFGDDVAQLVDGVTKLGQLEYSSEQSKQAENFQKFILATTKDIRVLLVKLSDRLHNMRTLHFIQKEDKRKRIARETLEIYAPLARRVGLYKFASELEDLAFEQINPQARRAIELRLKELSETNSVDLKRIETDLNQILTDLDFDAELIGRRKQPYSIWRKLQRKEISFRDVPDIFAFRVIVDDPEDCYRVLGALHTHWRCLPDRFRDYISATKPNGYRSLHTTLRAAGNRLVEVQIRTHDMDQTAKFGVAAHWNYKNSAYGFDAQSARDAGIDAEASLTAFAEMLEHGADAEEFFEHAKLEMFQDHVFAFTPKGRLVILPRGAMPLDFAYAVHTALGDTTERAKINGELRPLRTPLRNGDIVEIIRGDEPRAIPGWEALTITGRAKSAIRRLVRHVEKGKFHDLGRRLLDHALRKIKLDPLDIDLERVARRCEFEAIDPFLEAIGRGHLSVREVLGKAFPDKLDESLDWETRTAIDDLHTSQFISGVDLTHDSAMHLCERCMPVPGDRIVGVHKPDEGIFIHAIDCLALATEENNELNWLDLKWTPLATSDGIATGRLIVAASNRKGVLASLCTVVAEAGGNIIGISTGNRSADFIDLVFDIEVRDLRHLRGIMTSLRAISSVDDVERVRL